MFVFTIIQHGDANVPHTVREHKGTEPMDNDYGERGGSERDDGENRDRGRRGGGDDRVAKPGTNRTLAVIADDIRSALKFDTANAIRIGNLLIEARAKVKKHGRWLPWLKQEFSISDRTAQKYTKAAKFVAKYELSSDLKLSPSALYLLSEDAAWNWCDKDDRARATTAVLRAAATEYIEQERAQEIINQIIDEMAAADQAKREALWTKREADKARRLYLGIEEPPAREEEGPRTFHP